MLGPGALVLALLPAVAAGVKSRGFIVRHCVRSTGKDAALAQYSGTPMPQWGVPKNWCTERGVKLLEETGAALARDWALDPKSTRFFTDIVSRDVVSAEALIRGMGQQAAAVTFDVNLFSATDPLYGPALCAAPSKERTAAERRSRFQQVPLPWDFDAALRELQEIVGVGPAGPIANLGGLTLDDEGKPSGSARLLKLFGQLIFYAYASGIPFANATDQQINRFIAWQDWYRSVAEWTSARVVDNAQLLKKLIANLANPAGGADIYVGHDGNLDGIAAAFDLTWDAPPYLGGLLQPTPPGSGLWFEYDHDSGLVDAYYIYKAFNTTDLGAFLSVSRVQTWENFSAFQASAKSGLASWDGAMDCFNKDGASDALSSDAAPGAEL